MDGAGRLHPDAEAGDGQAVPDAGGGRVLDHGAGDGGHGPHRARDDQGGRGSGDRGIEGHAEDGGHGRGDVPKLLDEGQAGDNVGCLLRGIEREDMERGQVLAKPGSITPHTKFKAQVYVLTKEEGGRHTPFFKGYRPQFYFRTTDVTGAVSCRRGWRW